MGLWNAVTKQILMLGIVFYGLPIFWWTYNNMDENPENDYFLSVRFLMSTGSLMTVMGMTYVALPVGIVPNWIPIFGALDDMVAKMAAGGGMMMCYMGYKFGKGEAPSEFEMMVDVMTKGYNIVVPFTTDIIFPLLKPAVNAIAVPMKAFARALLGAVLEKARDPKTAETVAKVVNQASEL